ncbi:MAG: glycosyl transferase [Porticoccaceae bacterium]|nr:MAG: glycosyl transferase [Porticoccaceae bacterium]
MGGRDVKILYGVQATGNGHITRARAMAERLARAGVEVDWLFSGRAPSGFFDMEPFGDYRVVPGLSFAATGGRIDRLATLRRLRPGRLVRDLWRLDLDPYDAVVTDFEPVTAWAARRARRQAIGIGHQYAFLHRVPRAGMGPGQKLLLRHFAPVTTAVGLHWHHFGQPILPPIAPVPAGEAPARREVVVYLPFERPEDIRRLLLPHRAWRFAIYHPEAPAGREGHLHWHRPSRSAFAADLARAEGVVCNAGFELASEVLQLGRKLLVKPLAGQGEQISNALALELLGYGYTMRELDASALARWLQEAQATRVSYPDVAEALCHWLAAGAAEPVAELAARLWRAAELPDLTALTRTDGRLPGPGGMAAGWAAPEG